MTREARRCSTTDCPAPHLARGYCNRHYKQARHTGALPKLPPGREARFWAHVDKDGPGGCWLWTAYKSEAGYGKVGRTYGTRQAHRVAYEYVVGPIPVGLELDHLCRNTACVNPEHMEPVTPAVNRQREMAALGASLGIKRIRRPAQSIRRTRPTHCKRGHTFDEGNTDHRPNGSRRCRTCHREYEQRRRLLQAAAS